MNQESGHHHKIQYDIYGGRCLTKKKTNSLNDRRFFFYKNRFRKLHMEAIHQTNINIFSNYLY
jgi:hypothetical protein